MIGTGFNSVMVYVDVLGKTFEEIEKEAIEANLKFLHGNKSKVAKSLGIDRRTLYRKIAKYGITG